MLRRLLSLTALFSTSLAVLGSLRAEDHSAVEKRLTESAKLLSSDEFEGRGVGTPGIDKAAEYLAREFASMGLKTDLFDGTPYQKLTISTNSELGPKDKNRLELIGPPVEGGTEPRTWALEVSKDYNPLATGGTNKFDAPLVFVGYGITAKIKGHGEEFSYDDYAGLDVKGKVVVFLRKEPQQTNPHSIFDGKDPSEFATFKHKIANASEHGAVAIIMVNDGNDLKVRSDADTKSFNELLESLATKQAEFKKLENPAADVVAKHRSEVIKLAEQLQTVGKRLSSDQDVVLDFNGAGPESTHRKLPIMATSRARIDIILKDALKKDLATIEKEIDADLKPQSAELKGWKAVGETTIVRKEAEIKNVIAVLEGEGPHADETVIVGAHYDHIGRGGFGSLAPWTTDIHNGADDNASGTASLLEIARRITSSGKKPARRIVFMAFSGEERGLLGSAFYVKQPKFPLDKTVAMVNLDMVGRLKDNKLIVYGTGTAKEFDGLIDELNKKYQFDITRKPGGYGPSDHASFYGKKIPVFHMFTGTHSDYHRPSDDAEKLNIEGMRRIADLSADIVEQIANAPEKPTYVEIKTQESIASSGGGERPYFGSIPDYANDEAEGLALTGVAPDGPAQKAGIKPGDVIVQIGASKVTGIEDFDSALRKFKAGETAKVKVKRGAETLEVDVVLGKPR